MRIDLYNYTSAPELAKSLDHMLKMLDQSYTASPFQ